MTVSRVALSAAVIVLMIPGLIIEPGPVSEAVGIGALLTIWSVDDDEDTTE